MAYHPPYTFHLIPFSAHDLYTYFVHTVRIYVISGPGSRYLTTLDLNPEE